MLGSSGFAFLLLLAQYSSASPATFDDGVSAYDSSDYARAMKVWRPLAEQGDGNAQQAIGLLYDLGYGVAQSSSAAASWYRRAAEAGNKIGQFRLAFMLEEELYAVDGNIRSSEAFDWYRKAADQGLSVAQVHIVDLYIRNHIELNHELVAAWADKLSGVDDEDAAALNCANNARASNELGMDFECRLGSYLSLKKKDFWEGVKPVKPDLSTPILTRVVAMIEGANGKNFASYDRYYAALTMRKPPASSIPRSFDQYSAMMELHGAARIAVRARYVTALDRWGTWHGSFTYKGFQPYVVVPRSIYDASLLPFIVDESELPYFFDGGCSLITIDYDAARNVVLPKDCNGFAFTPARGTFHAELEGTLALVTY